MSYSRKLHFTIDIIYIIIYNTYRRYFYKRYNLGLSVHLNSLLWLTLRVIHNHKHTLINAKLIISNKYHLKYTTAHIWQLPSYEVSVQFAVAAGKT